MTWTIVKIGGSLYDWPELGEQLRAWLTHLDAERVLIVPGGGATAEAIRTFDQIHRLGEEASHWLAIQALSLNARFLRTLLPDGELVSELPDAQIAQHRIYLLDAFPFFDADEKRPDPFPHHWRVTSDSLAVRVAMHARARELILLKSSDWSGHDWAQATHAGIVDGYFVEALKQAPASLRTRIVNLRTWGPSGSSPAAF